jgi:hypothetical protein
MPDTNLAEDWCDGYPRMILEGDVGSSGEAEGQTQPTTAPLVLRCGVEYAFRVTKSIWPKDVPCHTCLDHVRCVHG